MRQASRRPFSRAAVPAPRQHAPASAHAVQTQAEREGASHHDGRRSVLAAISAAAVLQARHVAPHCLLLAAQTGAAAAVHAAWLPAICL